MALAQQRPVIPSGRGYDVRCPELSPGYGDSDEGSDDNMTTIIHHSCTQSQDSLGDGVSVSELAVRREEGERTEESEGEESGSEWETEAEQNEEGEEEEEVGDEDGMADGLVLHASPVTPPSDSADMVRWRKLQGRKGTPREVGRVWREEAPSGEEEGGTDTPPSRGQTVEVPRAMTAYTNREVHVVRSNYSNTVDGDGGQVLDASLVSTPVESLYPVQAGSLLSASSQLASRSLQLRRPLTVLDVHSPSGSEGRTVAAASPAERSVRERRLSSLRSKSEKERRPVARPNTAQWLQPTPEAAPLAGSNYFQTEEQGVCLGPNPPFLPSAAGLPTKGVMLQYPGDLYMGGAESAPVGPTGAVMPVTSSGQPGRSEGLRRAVPAPRSSGHNLPKAAGGGRRVLERNMSRQALKAQSVPTHELEQVGYPGMEAQAFAVSHGLPIPEVPVSGAQANAGNAHLGLSGAQSAGRSQCPRPWAPGIGDLAGTDVAEHQARAQGQAQLVGQYKQQAAYVGRMGYPLEACYSLEPGHSLHALPVVATPQGYMLLNQQQGCLLSPMPMAGPGYYPEGLVALGPAGHYMPQSYVYVGALGTPPLEQSLAERARFAERAGTAAQGPSNGVRMPHAQAGGAAVRGGAPGKSTAQAPRAQERSLAVRHTSMKERARPPVRDADLYPAPEPSQLPVRTRKGSPELTGTVGVRHAKSLSPFAWRQLSVVVPQSAFDSPEATPLQPIAVGPALHKKTQQLKRR